MTKKEKEQIEDIEDRLYYAEECISDFKGFMMFILIVGGMFLVSIAATHCS